jgi:hypothetical protein
MIEFTDGLLKSMLVKKVFSTIVLILSYHNGTTNVS